MKMQTDGDSNSIRQEINWTISYDGDGYLIPAIDRYPDRLEFSIIGFFDGDTVKAYFDKYRDVEMEALSEDQVNLIAEQYPLKCLPAISKIKVDGWELGREITATSFYSIPGSPNHVVFHHQDWWEEYLQLTGTGRYFSYTRIQVSFTKEFLEQLPWIQDVSSLELTVAETKCMGKLPLTFKLPRDFTGVHEESFCHPGTGREHRLVFRQLSHQQLEIPGDDLGKTLFVSALGYEVHPALGDGESLSFDHTLMPDGEGVKEAELLIFISTGSLEGRNGSPLPACMSRPAYYQTDEVTFALSGIEMKKKDAEVFCWRKEKKNDS